MNVKYNTLCVGIHIHYEHIHTSTRYMLYTQHGLQCYSRLACRWLGCTWHKIVTKLCGVILITGRNKCIYVLSKYEPSIIVGIPDGDTVSHSGHILCNMMSQP